MSAASQLLEAHGPQSRVAVGAQASGDVTCAQLLAQVASVAALLPPATPGSHIALVIEGDRYAFAVALLAAWSAGHAVALPPNQRRDTVKGVIDRPECVEVLHDTGAGIGLRIPDLLDIPPTLAPTELTLPGRLDAATQFTSGTTGQMAAWPKTFEQLFGEVQTLASVFACAPGAVFVATVGPAHLYGLLFSVLLPLTTGGAFVRATPFGPQAIAAAVQANLQPSASAVLVSVPAHLRACETLQPGALAGLAHIISSTAPLPASTAAALTAAHGVPLTEVFGSTETGGIATRCQATDPAWRPLPGVAVSVDSDGRLLVDSPFLPARLARPYRSGDLAELVADGSGFHHRGRADDVVKVGGQRVSLRAIEHAATEVVGIQDAAALAVADPTARGQRVLLAVAGDSTGVAGLRVALSDRFPPSTLPRTIKATARLPREANGKLIRRELLRLFGLASDGQPLVDTLDWSPGPPRATDGGTTQTFASRLPERYRFFEGHFEGYPVLAGAVQLSELVDPCLRTARPELGPLEALKGVKFTKRLAPGDAFTVELSWTEGDPWTAFQIPARRDQVLGRATAVRPMTEMVPGFRPCGLVPTYNNPLTVRRVVERLREVVDTVFVIDDGSDAEARAVCEALAADGLARVHHREQNGGKGAAVKTGFALALQQGFTHALQVDADGQHDLSRAADFLAAARQSPDAFVVGYPEYDGSVPKGRLVARRFTGFWVGLEAGRGTIEDAMVGFRVYPLSAAIDAGARGNWMDFDVEIAVRLAWTGRPVINLPVGVTYPDAADGGVSHFRPFMDNLRFSWMHSRLCTLGSTRWFFRKALGWRR